MLKLPFWKRRPPLRPPVASTGLFSKDEECRKDKLLRAQVDEAAAWVKALQKEKRYLKDVY